MTAVYYNTIGTERWNQEELDKRFTAEMERQRLHDYWRRNASGKTPDGTAPPYLEVTGVEPALDALDDGWNGKGTMPSDFGQPKQPEDHNPADVAEEIGERAIRRGVGRGRGMGG